MNYGSIYNAIISKAKSEGRVRKKEVYYEAHHIIPKCMGGLGHVTESNHPNIILLTAKEHYICHRLLCLIYPNNNKLKFAMWMMINGATRNKNNRYIPSARIYEVLRKEHSLVIIGKKHSEETKKKLSDIGKSRPPISEATRKKLSNKRHSEETKSRLSEINKNRPPISEATRKKLSEKICSGETRKKMSISAKNKPVMSDETRKKMSDSQLGHIVSDETRKKISESKKRNIK